MKVDGGGKEREKKKNNDKGGGGKGNERSRGGLNIRYKVLNSSALFFGGTGGS